jgi:HD-GYP domain-containing protein (c-di-GMP phosphodiesterase class II)
MFAVNPPRCQTDFSRNDRQTRVLPIFVAEILREWASVPIRAGQRHPLQRDTLRAIVSIVDAYVWHDQPTTNSARYLCESMGAAVDATRRGAVFLGGHSQRVARLSVRIARQLGWRRRDLATVFLAGMLHDVGKVGIDAGILHKPDRLTENEYGQVKTHSEIGFEMLTGIEPLVDILPAVLHHHERWNGGGYPHGLRGESIPILARIVAVADAHDAMISDRPYRKGMPIDDVRFVFARGIDVLWDPAVVDAYFPIVQNGSRPVAASSGRGPHGELCQQRIRMIRSGGV